MTAKQTFKRVGWALFTAVASLTVASAICGVILTLAVPGYEEKAWAMLVASALPVYLVALPLGWCVLRGAAADGREQARLGVKNFFVFLLICFPLMYGGNLLGTMLSSLLSGGTAQNPLENLAFDGNIFNVLLTVVLAPLFEEWFFRKQIIDRTARYGEKLAILLSAVAFALFHGNFYQMFYAFALGLVFGYVYTRTRRLRYTVLLHMIVNFIGMVVGPLVLSTVDTEALAQMQSGTPDEAALMALLPGLVPLLLYGLAILGLSVAGLVLLILRAGKLTFLPAPEELPKEGRFRTVWVNAGMILFVIASVGLSVASLFIQQG